MNYENRPKQESALGLRTSVLAAGTDKVPRPQTMMQDILDHNGNHLAALDQINSRLWSILQGMTGPQPRNGSSDQDKVPPEGSLHMIREQQSMIDEKLRETLEILEQIASVS